MNVDGIWNTSAMIATTAVDQIRRHAPEVGHLPQRGDLIGGLDRQVHTDRTDTQVVPLGGGNTMAVGLLTVDLAPVKVGVMTAIRYIDPVVLHHRGSDVILLHGIHAPTLILLRNPRQMRGPQMLPPNALLGLPQ